VGQFDEHFGPTGSNNSAAFELCRASWEAFPFRAGLRLNYSARKSLIVLVLGSKKTLE
jgi:hypothetical protein